MRTTKFRCGIVGLALVIASGCGGSTAGLESSEGISGAPPKAPTDDLMKPAKSKKAAKSKVPTGLGGPPPIPKH
ncbi:hypothetical protein [Paludisphaera borealis]|uniref:Uncharacterized protein n=1 Tax=Paludisphaera borealis TaxID=1387353 RepID=A0A1U7CTV0_9BACT|nr:hypothetical protein [Paludisphaera borealis]APW62380.1 hypothetical protein BSF38_03919 [Paludisphaera borealis]